MKKTYKVTLKTLAPVFIGGGETLRKNQYVYDNNTGTAIIIDERKLTQWLVENDKLNIFIKDISSNKNNRLKEALKSYGLDNFNRIAKYKLKVNGMSKHMNDLNLFVRDGANEAYIPGSSIKGALRTCLLKAFEEDTRHNVFGISVGDSTPLSNENLAVYQKIDFSKNAPKGLSLYRECVKPNTKVTFILTLEENIACIDKLQDSIQSTYKAYHEKWALPFVTARTTDLSKYSFFHNYDDFNQDRSLIYLGGGAGFVSKTLHYKVKDRETAKHDVLKILVNKFPVYRKIKGVPNHVPMALKLAIEDNKLFELGKCELFFEEI